MALTVALFEGPSIGAEPRSRFRVIDVMPDFWTYIDDGRSASPGERRALFEQKLRRRHPAVFTRAVVGEGDPDLYWRMLQPLLPRIREIHSQVNELLIQGEQTFRRRLPDFDLRQKVYVTPSLLNFDGATRTVGGETAILFGVDGMARMHPADRNFEPLVLHELFHAYHQFRDDGTFMSHLWREGLATYASRALSAKPNEADVLLSAALTQVEGPVLAQLAGEALTAFDSRAREDRDRFFSADGGDGKHAQRGLPPRCGYLVGYKAAQWLGRTSSLNRLAQLKHADVRTSLRAALAALAAPR